MTIMLVLWQVLYRHRLHRATEARELEGSSERASSADYKNAVCLEKVPSTRGCAAILERGFPHPRRYPSRLQDTADLHSFRAECDLHFGEELLDRFLSDRAHRRRTADHAGFGEQQTWLDTGMPRTIRLADIPLFRTTGCERDA